MTNSQKNTTFLNLIDSETKSVILNNIANHYGISDEDALQEVTETGAEHLLDYVTGPERNATYILMKKHNLA